MLGTPSSGTFVIASRADWMASASEEADVSSISIFVTGTSALVGRVSDPKTAPAQTSSACRKTPVSSLVISRLSTSVNLCPTAATSQCLPIHGNYRVHGYPCMPLTSPLGTPHRLVRHDDLKIPVDEREYLICRRLVNPFSQVGLIGLLAFIRAISPRDQELTQPGEYQRTFVRSHRRTGV